MLKKDFTNGWTQVPNKIINHKELSFKAKGLWMYINSKPDGWDFAIYRIVSDTKEAEKSVRTGLNELVQLGFLEYKAKYKNGKLAGQEYILRDYQYPPKRVPLETCTTENGGGISNTKSSKKESSNSKPDFASEARIYVESFNQIRKTKYRVNAKVVKQLQQRLKEGYTVEEIIKAYQTALNDEYHTQSGYKYLTPEFFTRADKLDRFRNMNINSPINNQPTLEELFNQQNQAYVN